MDQTRLVLRLRGRPAGLVRRRSGLDRLRVSYGLGRLLDPTGVSLRASGRATFEHVGAADWRAEVRVRTRAGEVREVRAAIAAPCDVRARERPGQVRAFVAGLVDLAWETGGEVDLLHAQPDEPRASPPSGVVTPARVGEVLAAVGLGRRQRR